MGIIANNNRVPTANRDSHIDRIRMVKTPMAKSDNRVNLVSMIVTIPTPTPAAPTQKDGPIQAVTISSTLLVVPTGLKTGANDAFRNVSPRKETE